MWISNLKLSNFRNYEFLDIQFSKGFNIIYGSNAQGKTNIVEAIFMCSSARSHRTSKDSELAKLGQNNFHIKSLVEKKEEQIEIEILFASDHKKRIKINEIPLIKIGKLMGNLNSIIFSPEDLLIIKEGPSERRRFIDITISQIRPSYFYDLQQYYKILNQRNKLLKEIQIKKDLINTLDIWDENLANVGSRIIFTRIHFLMRLSSLSTKMHLKLTNDIEKLDLDFVPSFKIVNKDDQIAIKDKFLEILKKNEQKDIFKGTTSYGPHRDDYDIILNDKNIKIYGSQGQQRTAILSVKLAEIQIVKEETSDEPILLLDDVMSELDIDRQRYLLENLGNIQTFITGTDISFFSKFEDINSSFYKVVDGTVIKT